MKFAEDVTKEMIENVLDVALHDLREYSKEAKQKYENNKSDEFQHSMATAFQLAAEMIENRLDVLED